jgi:hypothetical protein
VANPNYFPISFKTIKAQVRHNLLPFIGFLTVLKIFYPINNTHVGGGQLDNIVFRSKEQTNITFPFALDYQASNDPNYQVLTSLAEKCGVNGGAQSDITVNYKITVRPCFHIIRIRDSHISSSSSDWKYFSSWSHPWCQIR